jgi:hypothetical protein
MDEYSRSLTDDALAREIDRLLEVQPSGDFVARVRARINDEPVRSRWFRLPEMVIAGAAVVVIIVVGIWMPRFRPAHVADQPVANIADKSIPPAEEARNVPASVAASSPSQNATTSPPAPSVLISPDDAIGLRHFVSALQDGLLAPEVVPIDAADAEPSMPIVIESMTVAPLLSASEIQIGELQ